MVITWYGQSCFRIVSGEFALLLDPFSKKNEGLSPPRGKADVVLVTHTDEDHSGIESAGGEPFLISGPGEYEVKGVFVYGFQTFHDASGGKEYGGNTAYFVELEGIKLLHLGDFGERELTGALLEESENVDILFVPVGGLATIGAEQAVRVVKQVEPRIVIPMRYKIPGVEGNLEPAERFLKEMGVERADPVEKLTIKKKDLGEEENTRVVLLEPV